MSFKEEIKTLTYAPFHRRSVADQGVIAADQSDALLHAITESGRAPEDFLVSEGYVDEHSFYHAIANSIGANYIDLTDFELPNSLRDKIPVGLARLHRALEECIRSHVRRTDD
jgi:hypothetical protein